jgi:hypothetical protein
MNKFPNIGITEHKKEKEKKAMQKRTLITEIQKDSTHRAFGTQFALLLCLGIRYLIEPLLAHALCPVRIGLGEPITGTALGRGVIRCLWRARTSIIRLVHPPAYLFAWAPQGAKLLR